MTPSKAHDEAVRLLTVAEAYAKGGQPEASEAFCKIADRYIAISTSDAVPPG